MTMLSRLQVYVLHSVAINSFDNENLLVFIIFILKIETINVSYISQFFVFLKNSNIKIIFNLKIETLNVSYIKDFSKKEKRL